VRAAEARVLFDRNATTYDPVNRLLSLGLDGRWRRWVAERAAEKPGARVADVMSGTGQVAVEAARRGAEVTAIDISPAMLEEACRRASRAHVPLEVRVADAALPGALERHSFDAVSISFGLRYINDRIGLLRTLAEGVKPGGRVVALEFCVPPPGLISSAASVYVFHVLPRIGAALSPDSELHRYLRDSTRRMGRAEDIVALAHEAGLAIEEQRHFAFGLVLGLVCRTPMRG
jgi:demethylmenaquinone methyltransferase/2-methoxy-6-polyprenyl-1,4-benzoquinol methylase